VIANSSVSESRIGRGRQAIETSLIPERVVPPMRAASCARFLTPAGKSFSVMISLTIPSAFASSAPMTLRSRRARPRGRSPPASRGEDERVYPEVDLDVAEGGGGEARTRSPASARSNPPASAMPETAVITNFLVPYIASWNSRMRWLKDASFVRAASLRSNPAEKHVSPPESRIRSMEPSLSARLGNPRARP